MKISATLREYRRILKISKKPSKSEFQHILKIAGLGMLLVGFIGFFIQLLWQLVAGGL
jgi:protein transport protein SEC61 subunit gamma-like protein